MKPWARTIATQRVCAGCSSTFMAKRAAIYCSARCRERSRGKRTYKPGQQKAWVAARMVLPGYREKLNALANARATTIRRWLDAYKLRVGCVDCGYRLHAIALDFDHVRGTKTRNVCFSKSIKQAEAEIAKCEVRCANCHRVKTAARRVAA